jgi:hypothetical protein
VDAPVSKGVWPITSRDVLFFMVRQEPPDNRANALDIVWHMDDYAYSSPVGDPRQIG